MRVLLGDFSAYVRSGYIFKPIIGDELLHEDSNDNGVRGVNSETPKNLIVKSTTFPDINTFGLLLMVSHIIRSCPDRQSKTFNYIMYPIL
jgi:hypothetical protein